MITTLVTAPAVEPISTAEAKVQLNVETTDDDTYIDTLILNAREYTEKVTGRALITQTWDLFLDCFPSVIDVPYGNLQSVTTLKYLDTDGVQQTESSATYTVDTDSDPGRIYLAYQQAWPSIRGDRKSVEIRFIAGYGDASTDVPQPLIHAMQLLIGHYYENRSNSDILTIKTIPMAYHSLIANYRLWG